MMLGCLLDPIVFSGARSPSGKFRLEGVGAEIIDYFCCFTTHDLKLDVFRC